MVSKWFGAEQGPFRVSTAFLYIDTKEMMPGLCFVRHSPVSCFGLFLPEVSGPIGLGAGLVSFFENIIHIYSAIWEGREGNCFGNAGKGKERGTV